MISCKQQTELLPQNDPEMSFVHERNDRPGLISSQGGAHLAYTKKKFLA